MFINTITSSRKPKAVDGLKTVGVNMMIDSSFVSNAQNNRIMKDFEGHNMETQFNALGQIIHSYFHDLRFEIEFAKRIINIVTLNMKLQNTKQLKENLIVNL